MEDISTIESALKECISKASLIPAEDISLEDTYDQLQISDLDKVDIVMNLESQFNITITDDEMFQIFTVKQCMDLVLSKIS